MQIDERVNEEDLDWDDDVRVLGGTPYSGIAFLLYPDGSRKREVTYQNGFAEGNCREWHLNGNLKREWFAERGRATGKIKEWHADGTVKSIGEYEFGAELQYDEWDESGDLSIHRQIDENSELFKYVQRMRGLRSGGLAAEGPGGCTSVLSLPFLHRHSNAGANSGDTTWPHPTRLEECAVRAGPLDGRNSSFRVLAKRRRAEW